VLVISDASWICEDGIYANVLLYFRSLSNMSLVITRFGIGV